MRGLLQRLDEHSPGEADHGARVAVYSVAVGASLSMDEDELLRLRYAAELHDIGKLLVPAAYDPLEMRRHPLLGATLVAEYLFLEPASEAILHHQEWWNGSGYPSGIVGLSIPVHSRIVAVAEAFDAMTLPSWKSPVPESAARHELYQLGGTQFDPAIVELFLEVQPIIQPFGL